MPNRMDSMMSHAMGKVKAVKARFTGLVGVFRTLAEQHGEVTALLERAKVSDERFAQLWPVIRRELISHEQGELQEVYPSLRAREATRPLAERHDARAGELQRQIMAIDELAVGSPERREHFHQLIEMVSRHAREEENEIFRKAQDVIGKAEAEALEAKFLEAKDQVAKVL